MKQYDAHVMAWASLICGECSVRMAEAIAAISAFDPMPTEAFREFMVKTLLLLADDASRGTLDP